MLQKFQYACLVGSLALIGADRIDLFAGGSSFILRPFLVLVPLTILIGLLRRTPERMFQVAITPPLRRQVPFVAALVLFLIFSFISVPVGLDPERSIVAFFGFFLVVVLGFFTSVQILAEREQEKLVVLSVTLGLLVYFMFCIAESVEWTHGVTMNQKSLSWVQSMFAPDNLGPWLPRLSGTTIDPNRAGFVLTMYLVLLDRFATRSPWTRFLRACIAVFVLITLSRSAILCWAAYHLFSGRFWARLSSRRTLARVTAVGLLVAIVGFIHREEIANLIEVWKIGDAIAARVSTEAGSSGENHMLLIQRGLETWSNSAKTVMTGIGFAAAPKVLGDFFGDDKYGNFHCLYVTALAELGLPAFGLLMFILAYPFLGRRGAMPGAAAILSFNIGYQSHTEPIFWTVLALLWSFEARHWQMFSAAQRRIATF